MARPCGLGEAPRVRACAVLLFLRYYPLFIYLTNQFLKYRVERTRSDLSTYPLHRLIFVLKSPHTSIESPSWARLCHIPACLSAGGRF